MKVFIFLALFFLVFACKKKQETKLIESIFLKAKIKPTRIDSLNSEKKVQEFIRSIDSSHYKFELKKIKEFNRVTAFDIDSITKIIADSIGINQNHYFTDIDNNGFTDLLFIGDNHFCSSTVSTSCNFSAELIMSFSQDSIKSLNLIKGHGLHSIIPEINNTPDGARLKIHDPNISYDSESKSILVDMSISELTFKFNNLIELNEYPNQYKIEKIEFSTEGCYGSCPVFNLDINKYKEGNFIAKHYNFYDNTNDFKQAEEGTFTTLINDKDYVYILSILDYIDFPNLKNSYSVSSTDNRASKLRITYDNGKVKVIEDYGMIGTYGLKLLYEELSKLRFNQNWKKKTVTNNM